MDDIKTWESLTGKLYLYLLKNLNDKDIAEDILHDAFLKILGKRQFYRYNENYEGWAFRITKNVLIDHYRRNKTNADLENIQKQLNENDDSTDAYNHLIPALKEFIENLPEKYRLPLVLSDIKGVNQELIAQKLGLSVSGAKSRIQRARKMLKEYFLQCSEYRFDNRGKVVEFIPKNTSCICDNS